MCAVPLPPGVNPIAVDKYIILHSIILQIHPMNLIKISQSIKGSKVRIKEKQAQRSFSKHFQILVHKWKI
jgi:hypothetical protein